MNFYGDEDGDGRRTGVIQRNARWEWGRERGWGGEGGGEASMRNITKKSCGGDLENGEDLG